MIWPVLLESVSAYSWYLVFLFPNAPVPTHGRLWAGLFLIAVLPTWLGFLLNRKLLTQGLTYSQLLGRNIRWFVVYALAFTFGNFLLGGYLFSLKETAGRFTFLLPYCWQGIAWYFGAGSVLRSVSPEQSHRHSGIRAMESSLVLFIPALLLLFFMDYPLLFLALLSAGWFFLLAFSLAVERYGLKSGYSYRYDLILFHILVPFGATALVFILAFSDEFLVMLVAAKDGLLNIFFFIMSVLEKFAPPQAQPESNPEPAPFWHPGGMGAEMGTGPLALWLLILGLTLLTVAAGVALWALVKRLRQRVPVVANSFPHSRFSLQLFLRQLWLLVAGLAAAIGRMAGKVWPAVRGAGRKARGKVLGVLVRVLPPRTPYQSILHSYRKFLALGRRHGVPRQAFETPLEYLARLEQALNHSHFPAEEAHRLTGLFLLAYYGNAPVGKEQALAGKELVRAIGKALSRR